MNRRRAYLPPLVFLLAAVVLAIAAGGASARSLAAVPYSPAEVAPPSVCPGQQVEGLTYEEQVGVMFCLTNYARAAHGLAPLVRSSRLGHAAEAKSADILGCDEFSHEACGRPFTFWDQRFGYLKGCWKAGENIAWGTGDYSTVGAIFVAWLQSPEHHANILGPYREIGIAVQVGDLEGFEGAAVWTQDFGSHKC